MVGASNSCSTLFEGGAVSPFSFEMNAKQLGSGLRALGVSLLGIAVLWNSAAQMTRARFSLARLGGSIFPSRKSE
jgi:hypothetical protein